MCRLVQHAIFCVLMLQSLAASADFSDRVINAMAGEPLRPANSEECRTWYNTARQRCDQQQREWDACWDNALSHHMDPFQADRECKHLGAGSCYDALSEKLSACYTRVSDAKKAAQQAIRDGTTGKACDGKDVECLNAMQGAHSGALLMNGATPGVKGIQQGAAAVLHGQQNQMNMEVQRATTELDRAMTMPVPETRAPAFQPSPPPRAASMQAPPKDDVSGLLGSADSMEDAFADMQNDVSGVTRQANDQIRRQGDTLSKQADLRTEQEAERAHAEEVAKQRAANDALMGALTQQLTQQMMNQSLNSAASAKKSANSRAASTQGMDACTAAWTKSGGKWTDDVWNQCEQK